MKRLFLILCLFLFTTALFSIESARLASFKESDVEITIRVLVNVLPNGWTNDDKTPRSIQVLYESTSITINKERTHLLLVMQVREENEEDILAEIAKHPSVVLVTEINEVEITKDFVKYEEVKASLLDNISKGTAVMEVIP